MLYETIQFAEFAKKRGGPIEFVFCFCWGHVAQEQVLIKVKFRFKQCNGYLITYQRQAVHPSYDNLILWGIHKPFVQRWGRGIANSPHYSIIIIE